MHALDRRAALTVGGGAVAGLLAGCAARPTRAARGWLTAKQWLQDLAALDAGVRATHPAPWAVHPESQWKAGLARLRTTLPPLAKAPATVALIRQVALLDNHSGILPEDIPFHPLGVALRTFADGLFVLGSSVVGLVGARVTAVGRTPVQQLQTLLKPCISADNDSSYRPLTPWMLQQLEVLQALGVVHGGSVPLTVAMPDGITRTVRPAVSTVDDVVALYDGGYTAGTPAAWRAVPEGAAAARVQEGAVVISFGGFGQDAAPAIATMRAALRSRTADRVVFDQRYCGGGDYSAAEALRAALAAVRVPLTVVTGFDNASASGAQASWLRVHTTARFIGEPPQSVPDTFLDDAPFTLPNSQLQVHVPTTRMTFFPGSTATGLPLDRVVCDRGADFLAGIDRTLRAALA